MLPVANMSSCHTNEIPRMSHGDDAKFDKPTACKSGIVTGKTHTTDMLLVRDKSREKCGETFPNEFQKLNRQNKIVLNLEKRNLNQKDPIEMIRSSFKTGVIWNDCSVVKSPADGHCLLHSVVSSMKSQLFPPLETNTSALLSLIKNEFKSHPERYIRFIPGNRMSSFYHDFDRYAYSRIYDSKSVDLIPNILCNAFDMKLILLTGQTGITDVYNIEDSVTSFHLILQKCGEHYDGIAPIVPEPL